jgi:hypothetical protein
VANSVVAALVANNAVTTLVAKSSTLDLGFGWESILATTLAVMVPLQADWKVGIGEITWRGTIGDALRASQILHCKPFET